MGSLVGTTHVSSTAASKACKIIMEAMAGRLEQTARPGCTSYSLRSENHQLPSNSDWVEKHLKKPPKHITAAAAAEADHRVSSLVASAALRKSSLKKHKNDRPKKKNYLRYQKLNEDTLKETTHFASLVYCILL